MKTAKQAMLLLVTLAFTLTTPAMASVAIVGFTGGSLANNVDGFTNTIGYEFSPNQNITVYALGLYDTTLKGFHPTGIFDSAGSLPGSTVISSNSTLSANIYITGLRL